jgi:hypothetical protein
MASHGVPIKARHSSVTSNNEVRHMFSRAKCAVAIAALLVGAGTASAQGTRQRITAGPHGGIRSVTQSRGNGQFTGTRQAVGPHGTPLTRVPSRDQTVLPAPRSGRQAMVNKQAARRSPGRMAAPTPISASLVMGSTPTSALQRDPTAQLTRTSVLRAMANSRIREQQPDPWVVPIRTSAQPQMVR